MLGDAILPVDLDGDGILDFVTDSRVAGSAELLNFGMPSGSWRVAALPDPLPSLRVRAVAVADFDADGRRDLAIGYNSRSLAGLVTGLDVFLATGNPAAWRKVAIWTEHGTVDGISALAAGDLDGDGHVDLAAASAAGDTLLWLNDGTGGFAGELSPELRPGPEHQGCQGYAVAVRDLDGDGRSELMVAFAGEPGSEALLMGAVAPRCVAEGALRVWKIDSAPSAPAEGWYR
jgi:hypothetical protein